MYREYPCRYVRKYFFNNIRLITVSNHRIFIIGPTVVETLLRFTKVRTSVANHSLAKYRDSLESALDKDDLKEYYKRKVKHDEEHLPSWVTNTRR